MTRLYSTIVIASALLLTTGCCEPLTIKAPTAPEPVVAEPAQIEKAPVPPPAFPIVLLPSDTSSSVSLRFVFAAGSSGDPKSKQSITELTARLMARGGTEELAYPKLVEKLFPMAAGIDVQVGRDQTVFYGRVHRDHLEEYYGLIRDVLLTPRLDESDFTRISQKMTSELTLALRGNDDEELGKAALASFMYEGHPYGHPTIGTESGLAAVVLDDVKAHRAAAFCDARLTIGLAGAVTKEFSERIREDMKALPRCETLPPDIQNAPAAEGRRVLLVDKPTAESTAISIGFPVSVRRGEPDYAALKLVEAYFGQHRTFSGALQKAIRVQRGFNYGNYAYSEHFEQEGWQRIPKTNKARQKQHFSLWVRPVKDVDKHFVLRLAIRKLEELVDKGISEEDFAKTRKFMKRYYLTFAQTEARKLGYALDDHFYMQDKPYFEMLFKSLDALTTEAVNDAIKKHLTKDNLFIAMVTKNATDLKAAIAADTPSPVTYVAPKPDDIVAEDKTITEMKLSISEDAITIVGVNEIFK
ncbi:MAG: insulinase family protein [Deltaproteobacteria bacterium]|nr:insulinase family protein [Deltaproteobacteria bacterium]